MHSSRMRPSAAVAVSPGDVCLGRYLPRGCLPREVSAQGGVCLRGAYSKGMSAYMGVSAQGVSAWGVSVQGGCTPSPCGQTDTCKNITFLKLLLRMVTSGRIRTGFWTTKYIQQVKRLAK